MTKWKTLGAVVGIVLGVIAVLAIVLTAVEILGEWGIR